MNQLASFAFEETWGIQPRKTDAGRPELAALARCRGTHVLPNPTPCEFVEALMGVLGKRVVLESLKPWVLVRLHPGS